MMGSQDGQPELYVSFSLDDAVRRYHIFERSSPAYTSSSCVAWRLRTIAGPASHRWIPSSSSSSTCWATFSTSGAMDSSVRKSV